MHVLNRRTIQVARKEQDHMILILRTQRYPLVIIGCVIDALLCIFLPQVAHAAYMIPYGVYSPQSWGGAVGTRGNYTSVLANWNLPCIGRNTPASKVDIWIGIGGMHNNNMVQAGVKIKNSWSGGSQQVTYSLFTSNKASNETPVGDTCNSSGSIMATIDLETGNIEIDNGYTGDQLLDSVTTSVDNSTAEFIIEKPDGASAPASTLASFGSIKFSNAHLRSGVDTHVILQEPRDMLSMKDRDNNTITTDTPSDSIVRTGGEDDADTHDTFTVNDLILYPPESYSLSF